MKTFRPDVVLSLPNAESLVRCRAPNGQNVFRDILQVPAILLWHQSLLQFPELCLDPLPPRPAESRRGALRRMRKMLDHPLYHHYISDRGQLAALRRLGMFRRAQARPFLQPAYPHFVRSGYRGAENRAFACRVAFAADGHTRPPAALSFRDEPVLARIEDQAVARKMDQLGDPLWDLLAAGIGSVGRADRMRLRLDSDSTFFWRFVHDEITAAGDARVRCGVLAGLNEGYDFFGGDGESGARRAPGPQAGATFRRSLDYFTELPLLFINSDIIIDVLSGGYSSGVSPKVMNCLACGGFVIFDYKDDFRQAFGDVADQVMYRNADHLNSLIDHYLGNPEHRHEVSRYLQYYASTKFTFGNLCHRLLVEEPLWRR
jgi:glycosyl transferase family 1